MDKNKFEGEDIRRTVMSKFTNLKLEDREDPYIIFFEAYILWEEMQRNGETITDCAYKDVVIRAIQNSYSDVKVVV